jgi:hypothetical protein
MSRTRHRERAVLGGAGREFWGRIPMGKVVRDFGGRWRKRLLAKTWRRWWKREIGRAE